MRKQAEAYEDDHFTISMLTPQKSKLAEVIVY